MQGILRWDSHHCQVQENQNGIRASGKKIFNSKGKNCCPKFIVSIDMHLIFFQLLNNDVDMLHSQMFMIGFDGVGYTGSKFQPLLEKIISRYLVQIVQIN